LQLNHTFYLTSQFKAGIHNNKFFIFLHLFHEVFFRFEKHFVNQWLLKMNNNEPNSIIMPAADFLLMADFMLWRGILMLSLTCL